MKKISLLAPLLSSSILAMASLSGCSSEGGSSSFAPRLDTDYACELKVVGSYSNFEQIEEEFERFEAYYPNVSMSYQYLDNYRDVIDKNLANVKPNIYVEYDSLQVNPLNLSDLQYGLDFSAYRESLLYHNADREVTMVPVFSNTYGMLVNEDLLRRYGINEVPTTFDAFTDALRILKSNGGFESPIMSYLDWLYYTNFATGAIGVAAIAEEGNLDKINALGSEGGQALLGVLNNLHILAANYIDPESWEGITNNYNSLILRFFEGDVPFMITSGDTVTGTRKRETRSEAFSSSPFAYSFHPVPLSNDGLTYYEMAAGELAINKDCENLDMTVEFMRFIMQEDELRRIAESKDCLSVTKDLSFQGKYSSFDAVPDSNIFNTRTGMVPQASIDQAYYACLNVLEGSMTPNEAANNFGKFTSE